MENYNDNRHDQINREREEIRSRYHEPTNDLPYEYRDVREQPSRYQQNAALAGDQQKLKDSLEQPKSDKQNEKTDINQFPESPTNRDNRGLPGAPSRTDERIRNIVTDRLFDDPQVDARDVDVNVVDGRVFLRGTVQNNEALRRAQSLAEIPGTKSVDNMLRVRPEPTADEDNEVNIEK